MMRSESTKRGSFQLQPSRKRNGHWVWKFASGQVDSGPYVDGEQFGRWRVRCPGGEVEHIKFIRGVCRDP